MCGLSVSVLAFVLVFRTFTCLIYVAVVVLEISVYSVGVFVFHVYVKMLLLSEHNFPRGIYLLYK